MTQIDCIISKYETNKFIISMRNDGIVHVFYKDNLNIDIKTLYEMIEGFNEICTKAEYCIIFEAGKGVRMSPEARNYTFKLEKYIPFKASCVIAQNKFYLILAEFFFYIKKPSTPYRFFTKFEDGIAWLNSL